MKKLKLKALELGAIEVLARTQLKNVLGGVAPESSGGGDTHLCYCDLPILDNGQYGIQWTFTGTCKDADASIGDHCSGTGDCGGC